MGGNSWCWLAQQFQLNPDYSGLVLGSTLKPQPHPCLTLLPGDTTQDSTVLWARSPSSVPVTFEYSTDPDFSTVVTKTVDVTNPLQPVKLPVTGLNWNRLLL